MIWDRREGLVSATERPAPPSVALGPTDRTGIAPEMQDGSGMPAM